MPVITALGEMKQDCYEFKGNLGHRVSYRLPRSTLRHLSQKRKTKGQIIYCKEMTKQELALPQHIWLSWLTTEIGAILTTVPQRKTTELKKAKCLFLHYSRKN